MNAAIIINWIRHKQTGIMWAERPQVGMLNQLKFCNMNCRFQKETKLKIISWNCATWIVHSKKKN